MPAMVPGDRGQRELIGADEPYARRGGRDETNLACRLTSGGSYIRITVADMHWRDWYPTAHNGRNFNWLPDSGGYRVFSASLFSREPPRDFGVFRPRGAIWLPSPPPPLRAGRLLWESAPRFSPPSPAQKAYSIWPTGYISYRRPGDPEPFVSPDDGLGIALLDLPWIKAGPVARFIDERTLSGGFGTFGNNETSSACIMSDLRPSSAAFWNSGQPNSSAPASRHARELAAPKASMPTSNLDLSSSYGAFTFSAGPRFQFGDDRFVSAYFLGDTRRKHS